MKAYRIVVAVVALIVVGAATLVPLAGVLVLGPAAALVVSTVSAYLTWRDEAFPIYGGLWTGFFAGIGALLGMAIAITFLHVVIISDLWMEDFIRWTGSFSEVTTMAIKFLVGLILGFSSFTMAMSGGVLGTALRTLRTRGSIFPSARAQ